MSHKSFYEMQLTIGIFLFVTVYYCFRSIAVECYFWNHSHINVYQKWRGKIGRFDLRNKLII